MEQAPVAIQCRDGFFEISDSCRHENPMFSDDSEALMAHGRISPSKHTQFVEKRFQNFRSVEDSAQHLIFTASVSSSEKKRLPFLV